VVTTPVSPSLRVIFFGTPAFAVPTLEALLRSSHVVVGAISQPDRPRGRGQRVTPPPVKLTAEAAGVPVLQPVRLRADDFLDSVRALAPDLGVVAAYGRLIPDVLLTLPRLGMINVHASLLPRYRGASPIQHAVMAGDPVTGVTIMRVVSELDAGPMLDRVEVPIGPEDTAGDVEKRLAHTAGPLLIDVVNRLAAGDVTEVPQEHAAATLAPRLDKHVGEIDWSRSAEDIHNQVRGLQPWPGTWTFLRNVRLGIRRTRPTAALLAAPVPAGTIVTLAAGEPGVVCGDGGVLEICEVQPEGRRVMTARDFLAGHPVPPDTRLGQAP
jgi:methionyl-tRNA formyltransferase